MTLVVPYLIFLLSVITQVDAIRCQCSTNRGPIPCYNNWCEVNKKDGKEGACAVIQSGNSRTFACVLVKKDSGDECKVDRVEGRMQARCWCRSSDYCNVDLAERIEEDQEDDDYRQISAEEIATSSSPKQFSAITEPREDFVINAAYVDEDLTQVTYDDGDFSLEDDFPHDIYPIPPVPSSTLKSPIGPTIPPWRREVPASDDRQPPSPPRIPERPDRIPSRPQEKDDRWPERVPERVPERTPEEEEKTRREEQEKYRREWERAMDEYRRRQAEKDPWTPPTQVPVPPPPTPPRRESTTTTTTKRPKTSREPERIPERPRYIEPPTTTSTSKRTEKPTTTSTTSTTTSTTSTTTSTTTTTTPRSSPSTESVADAFARVKENQEIARKSYQNHRNRYRVYDFFKTSSTTSSSTSTTTSNPSTPPPTTLRTTTIVSTKKETETPTTRRRTTTTTEKTTTVDSLEEEMEEESPTNVPEEEKIPENIHRSGQEFKPKTSSLPGYLLALFLICFL